MLLKFIEPTYTGKAVSVSKNRTRTGNPRADNARIARPQQGIPSSEQWRRKRILAGLADQAVDWLRHAGDATHKEVTSPMTSLMRYLVTGDASYQKEISGITLSDRDWVRREFVKFSSRKSTYGSRVPMFAIQAAWYQDIKSQLQME